MSNYIYSVPVSEREKGGTGPLYSTSGKARVLTTAEAVTWVEYQVWRAANKRRGGNPRYIDPKNIKSCIEYIEGYSGRDGGTGYTYKGHRVIHISHGKKGPTDGCTLFFCIPADKLASIIVIGAHAGDGDHTYSIDWVKDGWHDRRLCSTIKSK